jgi:pilus assembly protein CpaB
MKNTRAIWMLVISMILGVVVVVMAGSRVASQTVAANKVAVAAVDIEFGSKLNPQMLTIIDWPQGSTPSGTFSDVKDLQDRVLKTSVQRGEAILGSKLAPVGSAGGLSAVIADGKRAMTVRVNDVVGVAGFALPGNYVDILVNTLQETGKENETKPTTRTVLEHVLVLAIAQEASRDDTKPKVVSAVTLELSPAEAEKIDLARNVGSLSLVLRNQIDKATVETTGFTKSQLFGEEPPKAIAATKAAPKPVARSKPIIVANAERRECVEVIQDGVRTQNCF